MKRNINQIIVAGVIAAVSTTAFADSFDIKISGKVKPGACTPVLVGGGIFDYGNIGSAELSPTSHTLLKTMSDTLTITCDAAARVALKVVDNRAGTGAFSGNIAFFGLSVPPIMHHGLGTASSKNIGAYAYRFTPGSFQADGVAVDSIYSSTSGSTWGSSNGLANPSDTSLESWSKKGQSTPVAAKVFTGKLEVQAAIDKTTNLDMSQEIDLDGLATVSLVYL